MYIINKPKFVLKSKLLRTNKFVSPIGRIPHWGVLRLLTTCIFVYLTANYELLHFFTFGGNLYK